MVGHIRDLSFAIRIGYCTEELRLNIYCSRCQSRAIQNILDDLFRYNLGFKLPDTSSSLDNLGQFIHEAAPVFSMRSAGSYLLTKPVVGWLIDDLNLAPTVETYQGDLFVALIAVDDLYLPSLVVCWSVLVFLFFTSVYNCKPRLSSF